MIAYEVSGPVATLRLNAPPHNALTPRLLEELLGALGRANADRAVRGIVILGDENRFSAGAEVELFREVKSAEDAVALSRTFQDALEQLEDSPKPVAAALAGTVLGGAIELAAACHFRVATTTARFRMPEVTLGIIPGAGGTQRLPRLVGVEAGLRMLLAAETFSAEKARDLGLVDEVVDRSDLLSTAHRLVASGEKPEKTRVRADKLGPPDDAAVILDKAQERIAIGRAEIIAPFRILQCVRTGLEQSFEAGLAAERTGFAQCMETPAARNKLHLFFATRRLTEAIAASTSARSFARAAVVGVGTMGTGIVQALASAGLPVVAIDQRGDARDRALQQIEKSLRKRAADGKLGSAGADEILGRIALSGDPADANSADLVIEAVYEDLEVKRPLIERLENVCSNETVIATNTSTLSLTEIAAGLRRPERFLGLHFFNPAHHMPLVEVIRHERLAPDVLTAALGLMKRMRKTPVVVKNREGFVVNRLFIPYVQEAFSLLEEGADAATIDAAMVQFGFPMGPLVLIDMAGIDILADAHRVLYRADPRLGPLSPIAHRLVAAGRSGQKAGEGVYRYQPGDRTPRESPATEQIIVAVRTERKQGLRTFTAEEIEERLAMRMVCEAGYVMAEQIVDSADDMDVATVLGLGFPDFRGGVMRMVRDMGETEIRARLNRLAAEHGERFAPASA